MALGKRSDEQQEMWVATTSLPKVTQTFVYTDVVVTGSSALGQLIELQVQG